MESTSIAETNCRFATAVNQCLVCAQRFVVDPNTRQCTAVATVVDGCAFYSRTPGQCEVCASTHYMNAQTRTCEPLPAQKQCYCYAGKRYVW